MTTFGLIGYPLEHSFSKKYFEQKFKDENISGVKYTNIETERLETLFENMETFIENMNTRETNNK